jgi:hypothetical protein
MEANWEPAINEIGGVYYPLGNAYAVISTDGTKGISGTLTIVSIDDDMDYDVQAMLQSSNIKLLTMPNGDEYYVVFDPTSARKGAKDFSMMNTSTPVNVWTVDYLESSSS